MKIKIEKKSSDKFIIFFADESKIEGKYLTSSELKKLYSNLRELIEFNMDKTGDEL